MVVGMPFTRPLLGATVEAVQDAEVIAATTTGDHGRYELRVPPGSYLIRVTAGGLFAEQPERKVTISPGETLRVRFVLGRASPMMR
jgi:Carboxypeptidase regulatory-like domain